VWHEIACEKFSKKLTHGTFSLVLQMTSKAYVTIIVKKIGDRETAATHLKRRGVLQNIGSACVAWEITQVIL
jgi:hypothetical protein